MSLRPLLGIAFVAAGCVAEEPAQSTFPQQQWQAQPQMVSGPPGGAIDPGYGYQTADYNNPELSDQPGYPQGYPGDSVPPSTEEQGGDQALGNPNEAEPSENPQDPGYVMGNVNDQEIDATLDGYGSWEDSDDYGRVWRPNTTVVGVDFTPYESCGSWIWSDWGWNYSCDWSWGWLPFHYGRWGWFDNSWGWVPGYEWSPGAVEWRGGGGYVGWRPLTPQIRDHRGEHNPPTFHDHRGDRHGMVATAHDSHWRFASEANFGHGHIRGKLLGNPAEGLRVTSSVGRPAIRGNYQAVSSASLMRNRLSARASFNGANNGVRSRPWGAGQGQQGFRQPNSRANETPTWRPRPQQQPTWQRPQQSWQQPSQSWQRPPSQQNYQRPPAWNSRPSQSWNNSRPSQSWGGSRPSQSWGGSRPSAPPSWGGSRPSSGGGGGFHPSAPSHSSGGGGGYHSSGSSSSSHSSGSSSSHSSGGGSHSSGGGGGHHR